MSSESSFWAGSWSSQKSVGRWVEALKEEAGGEAEEEAKMEWGEAELSDGLRSLVWLSGEVSEADEWLEGAEAAGDAEERSRLAGLIRQRFFANPAFLALATEFEDLHYRLSLLRPRLRAADLQPGRLNPFAKPFRPSLLYSPRKDPQDSAIAPPDPRHTNTAKNNRKAKPFPAIPSSPFSTDFLNSDTPFLPPRPYRNSIRF